MNEPILIQFTGLDTTKLMEEIDQKLSKEDENNKVFIVWFDESQKVKNWVGETVYKEHTCTLKEAKNVINRLTNRTIN